MTKLCTIADCNRTAWARGLCRMHYSRWREHGDPTIVKKRQSPAGACKAFMDALPMEGEGCVMWPFARNGYGYAQVNTSPKKTAIVSRIVCERRHGPPPTGKHQAAHECGRGHEGCIAPWHLFWKTSAENHADMDRHGTRQRGERHYCAKITSEDVKAIRALAGTDTYAAIGRRFGLSSATTARIIRRELWAHVQ